MTTEKEILQITAEYLGLAPEDLDKDSNLRSDLSLGPIELNDLLSFLAKEFNITFDKEDASNLKTVADLISVVEDNLIE